MLPSINPLSEIRDPVSDFFRSLGYDVTWDFNRSNGDVWYEVSEKNGPLIVQFDMGVPLDHLIEDFSAYADGKPGTSASFFTVNTKPNDPRFEVLTRKVAAARRIVI